MSFKISNNLTQIYYQSEMKKIVLSMILLENFNICLIELVYRY